MDEGGCANWGCGGGGGLGAVDNPSPKLDGGRGGAEDGGGGGIAPAWKACPDEPPGGTLPSPYILLVA